MTLARFERVYVMIDRVRTVMVVGIFIFVISVGAVQIFMRYTPGINAMSWVDEIMRYLNIWLVLLAASIGVKNDTHLKMDYLLKKHVSEKILKIIRMITQVLIVVALLILIFYGTLRVLDNIHTMIQSLPISIAVFYAAIPIGGILILFEYLLTFIFKKHPYARIDARGEVANAERVTE